MTEQTLIRPQNNTPLSLEPQPGLVLEQALPPQASPVNVYLAGLSEASRRPMAGALAALRGVLKAARKLHLMDVTTCQDCLDEARTIKGQRVAKGRSLNAGEILALMSTCGNDQSTAGVRDAALIGLLYGCGLRRAEVVALDRAAFSRDGALLVRGKGNKERQVYVEGGARRALDDWLMVRGDEPGPLFFPIRRGGHIQRRRLTAQAVLDILTRRGRQAGVARFSPHDLRRGRCCDGAAYFGP